jgi:hypothetical protein
VDEKINDPTSSGEGRKEESRGEVGSLYFSYSLALVREGCKVLEEFFTRTDKSFKAFARSSFAFKCFLSSRLTKVISPTSWRATRVYWSRAFRDYQVLSSRDDNGACPFAFRHAVDFGS